MAVSILSPVSNDAQEIVSMSTPYIVTADVVGTTALLFHRWSVEGIDAKSKAAKGSKAKKSDDLESYVYRDDKKNIAIPSEYFRMSVINAAKFRQDPRSPRKSAMDLFKAGIATIDEFCSLGKGKWDFVDQRRVAVQRSGITRNRPAMSAGWKTTVMFQVLLPEYIAREVVNEVLQAAGRLVGVGDFRPTYGRFQVSKFSANPAI